MKIPKELKDFFQMLKDRKFWKIFKSSFVDDFRKMRNDIGTEKQSQVNYTMKNHLVVCSILVLSITLLLLSVYKAISGEMYFAIGLVFSSIGVSYFGRKYTKKIVDEWYKKHPQKDEEDEFDDFDDID